MLFFVAGTIVLAILALTVVAIASRIRSCARESTTEAAAPSVDMAQGPYGEARSAATEFYTHICKQEFIAAAMLSTGSAHNEMLEFESEYQQQALQDPTVARVLRESQISELLQFEFSRTEA